MRRAISKRAHPRAPVRASRLPSPYALEHAAGADLSCKRSLDARSRSRAAGLGRLHRRTGNRAVGAEDTAIAGFGFQGRAAARALVKVDARIEGHLFPRRKAAFGTDKDGDPDHRGRDAVAGDGSPAAGNCARTLSAFCANTRLSRCGNSVLPRRALSWCMSSMGRGGPAPLHVASGPYRSHTSHAYTRPRLPLRSTASESKRPNAPSALQ